MWPTKESNNQKIEKLEALIKAKNNMKNKRIKLLEYQAGIKEDISDKLNIIKDIEKDKETSKELVPKEVPKTTTGSTDDGLTIEEVRKLYRDLGVFKSPIVELNKTARFTAKLNPDSGAAEYWINKVPFTRFDPVAKVLVIKGTTLPFNKNVIDLLRGDVLTGKKFGELQIYRVILEKAGAWKNKGRYKHVVDKINELASRRPSLAEELRESGPLIEEVSADEVSADEELDRVFAEAEKEAKGEGFIVRPSAMARLTPIKFLPNDPVELLKRLEIITLAIHNGHSGKSLYNEKHAILKRLLKKKEITKDQYKEVFL